MDIKKVHIVKYGTVKSDNVHMLEIIRSNENMSNDILYNALDNRYTALIKRIKHVR